MWSTIEQRDIDVLWKHYVSTSIKGKITPMLQRFADTGTYPQTSGVRKIYKEPVPKS